MATHNSPPTAFSFKWRKQRIDWILLLALGFAPLLIADDVTTTPTREVTEAQPIANVESTTTEPVAQEGFAGESTHAANPERLRNEFAFAAYAALASERPEGNLVFSPADLARVLSLVHAGANGPTRDEIAVALGFVPSGEAWSAIDAALNDAIRRPRYLLGVRAQNNRGYGLLITETLPESAADRIGLMTGDLLLAIDGSPMQSEEDFVAIMDRSGGAHSIEWYALREGQVRRVEIALDPLLREDASSVHLSHRAGAWLQQDYPLLPSYTATLAGGYAADISAIDFTASGEAAAAAINEWARSHTNESLRELLKADDIEPDTRLVLASVLAFKGNWEIVFDPELTRPGTFHVTADRTVDVPMMNMNELLSFAETESDVAVDLMFKDSFLSLTAVLPKSEAAESLVISEDRLNALVTGQHTRRVELTMPKVDFSFRSSVATSLKSLGVTTMFDIQTADLSGMTTVEELRVDDVLHASAVQWDEVGAEAVASTAVTVVPRSAPGEVVVLRFDRPFVFVIRDTRTGAILFLGRVNDPSV